MNRFDRVISILTMLHTKRLITAKEIADRFEVSERTIYRDIRTLENAGVPIGSEAGLGYYLDKSYRLPPVMFDREEAVALLLAEKFIHGIRDQKTGQSYRSALDKVKAVLDHQDKDYLNTLAQHVDVHTGIHESKEGEKAGEDRWLEDIQSAIVYSRCLNMAYFSHYRSAASERTVEPIGLFYYSRHWHLIAWCQTRNDYRDFRLDRIQSLQVTTDHFDRRNRASLNEYLKQLSSPQDLHKVTIHIRASIATFMQNQKYYYGFVSQEQLDDDWITMDFLIAEFEYFARWLLSYTDAIKIIEPNALQEEMLRLFNELKPLYS